MKLLGHTMGTPDLSVAEAIDLFADIGFDGIELRCGEPKGLVTVGEKTFPVKPFSPDWPLGNFHLGMGKPEFRKVREHARKKGLEIVTLTPYVWDINVPDSGVVRSNLDEFTEYVGVAEQLGATYVRVFAGREIKGGGAAKAWADTVTSLREMADCAAGRGVTVLLENHSGTMTPTGHATARMIRDIDRDNVRVLLDIANVLIDGNETWEQALESQRGLIEYLHVKDIVLLGGAQHPRVMGHGQVPWNAILRRLLDHGFDGPLSLEYERRWHPEELPPAEEGMRESRTYLVAMLDALKELRT
jgi:sugar phosphate isomerase/epimerase